MTQDTNNEAARPYGAYSPDQNDEILVEQVRLWTKERDRLQDLIAAATASQSSTAGAAYAYMVQPLGNTARNPDAPQEPRASVLPANFLNPAPGAPAVPEGVDTPEFRELLGDFGDARMVADKEIRSRDLIAHIDGLLAQQREAGRREGFYDPNDICTKCKKHAYDCNCEWPGIPGAASPVQGAGGGASGEAPYRVYEFWSSSSPGTKVRMLAEGGDIEAWPKRRDFIRDVTAERAPAVQQVAGQTVQKMKFDHHPSLSKAVKSASEDIARFKAKATPAAQEGASPVAERAIPDVLFDGQAVYDEAQRKRPHGSNPTPAQVADTLDAIVRLIRRAAPTSTASDSLAPDNQKGEA